MKHFYSIKVIILFICNIYWTNGKFFTLVQAISYDNFKDVNICHTKFWFLQYYIKFIILYGMINHFTTDVVENSHVVNS
jgi:hypothetical protein